MNHYNNYKYNLHKNYTISLCTCVKNENAIETTILGIAALFSNHSSNVGVTYPLVMAFQLGEKWQTQVTNKLILSVYGLRGRGWSVQQV